MDVRSIIIGGYYDNNGIEWPCRPATLSGHHEVRSGADDSKEELLCCIFRNRSVTPDMRPVHGATAEGWVTRPRGVCIQIGSDQDPGSRLLIAAHESSPYAIRMAARP